jgi:uncharacterized OsmC-like protein
MNMTMKTPPERKVITTQDGLQHCSAVRQPDGNILGMDCPYTGKGEEFSPTNLVEAGLAGCMLLAMGTLAMRNNIDITGTKMEVKVSMTDMPRMRFKNIEISVDMPSELSVKDRKRLEGAAEQCPIKHSFAADVSINVVYKYPD